MIIGVAALAVLVGILTVITPLLRRITEHGHTPRLSMLAWFSMSGTLLVSWALAGIGALWMAYHESMRTILHVGAVDLIGFSWPVDVFRYIMGIALILPLTRFLFFLFVGLARARQGRRRRRSALRLLGETDTTHQGVVEVSSDVPMVYCMPGKPDVIVVTTGAKESLSADQFAAVLAHERAHLAERHHLLIAVAHAMGRVSRWVRLFRDTERSIRVLVEMRADDVASLRFASEDVTGAMRRLSAQAPPAPALGASGRSVAARIMRMADPPTRGQRMLAAIGSCSFAGLSWMLPASMAALLTVTVKLGDTCLFIAG
jgi:beta-lactamase regulating signal transducer with metallopeptidase domain